MTSTQPDPKPTVPGMKLQRMRFGDPVEQDDKKVVYKASIENPDGVCTLTVTAAAQLYHTDELDGFLDEIWAGFLLTAPNATKDTADDSEPEPNDLDRETVIEIDVQLRAPDDTSDVIVEVIATAAEEDDSTSAEVRSARKGQPPAPRLVRPPLAPGQQKRWYAPGGRSKTATASAIQGNGTLRKQSALTPNKYLGVKKQETASSVWVRGGNKRLLYDLIY
jgi:hypothetical protein